MKIYLASAAPGNESVRPEGMLCIKHRLLSYYPIIKKELECDKVFAVIRRLNKRYNRRVKNEGK